MCNGRQTTRREVRHPQPERRCGNLPLDEPAREEEPTPKRWYHRRLFFTLLYLAQGIGAVAMLTGIFGLLLIKHGPLSPDAYAMAWQGTGMVVATLLIGHITERRKTRR